MAWIAAVLPGLWVASLLAALGRILSRGFDAVPARVWLALGLLLAALFAPVLFAGRVLFPVQLLNGFLPTDTPPGGPTNGLYGDLVLQILPWFTRVRADYLRRRLAVVESVRRIRRATLVESCRPRPAAARLWRWCSRRCRPGRPGCAARVRERCSSLPPG